jgi:hypothetical protein
MGDVFKTWRCQQCGEAMVSQERAKLVSCQFCGTLQPLTKSACALLDHHMRIPDKLNIDCTRKPNGEHWRIRFHEYSNNLSQQEPEMSFHLAGIQLIPPQAHREVRHRGKKRFLGGA